MPGEIYISPLLAPCASVFPETVNRILTPLRPANCKMDVLRSNPDACENAKSCSISDESQNALSFIGMETRVIKVRSNMSDKKEFETRLSKSPSFLDSRGSPNINSDDIIAATSPPEITELNHGDKFEVPCSHSSTNSSISEDDASWVECIFPGYASPLSAIPYLDEERESTVVGGKSLIEDATIQFQNDFSLDFGMGGTTTRILQQQLQPIELGDLSSCEILPYLLPSLPDSNVSQINSKKVIHHHTFTAVGHLQSYPDDSYIRGSWELAYPLKNEEKFVSVATAGNVMTGSRENYISIAQMIHDVQEENGLQIVHLLLTCVEAIKVGDLEPARLMLARLQRLTSSLGNPIQRLAVYFTDALSELIIPHLLNEYSCSPVQTQLSFSTVDREVAYQAFYQALPFVKFAHLTANQAILEAVTENGCIHIVDLDVKQGLQWSSFIQSLAMRPEGPVFFKLTAVGSDEAALQQTGRRLLEFAKSLQVPFGFSGITSTIDDLHPAMFEIEKDDIVAIGCPFMLHRLLKNHQKLHRVLSMIKYMSPTLVTVLEVEANLATSFEERFVDSLHYYSAVFDALEYTLGREDLNRLRIESIHLAAEMRSAIALDDSDSAIRYMRNDNWHDFLTSWAGWRDVSFSYSAIYQARLFLSMYSSSFKICEEGVALTLGWQDTPIVSVSIWTC